MLQFPNVVLELAGIVFLGLPTGLRSAFVYCLTSDTSYRSPPYRPLALECKEEMILRVLNFKEILLLHPPLQ